MLSENVSFHKHQEAAAATSRAQKGLTFMWFSHADTLQSRLASGNPNQGHALTTYPVYRTPYISYIYTHSRIQLASETDLLRGSLSPSCSPGD